MHTSIDICCSSLHFGSSILVFSPHQSTKTRSYLFIFQSAVGKEREKMPLIEYVGVHSLNLPA